MGSHVGIPDEIATRPSRNPAAQVDEHYTVEGGHDTLNGTLQQIKQVILSNSSIHGLEEPSFDLGALTILNCLKEQIFQGIVLKEFAQHIMDALHKSRASPPWIHRPTLHR